MSKLTVECLKDCKAICCREDIYLPLAPPEARYLRRRGTVLKVQKGEANPVTNRRDYKRIGRCSEVKKDNKCRIRGKPQQPKICGDLPPGSKPCLRFRAIHEKGVKQLTEPDRRFQRWFNGEED